MMMAVVVPDGSDSIPKVDAAPAPAETQTTTHWKKPNLSLQIPSNASDSPPPQPDFLPINIPAATPTPRRLSFLFTPSPSSIPRSPFKNLPNRGFGSDVESGGEAATVSSGPRENKSSISRSLSLIFSPRIKNVKGEAAVISRSLSVPASDKAQNLQRVDSFFLVIPSTTQSIASDSAGGNDEAGGEDLPEEEAICRICFVELCVAARQTLKLECSCRGELALAHQDCAVKWFSVKGNQTCDVCNQQVQNLPVHLLRIPSDAATLAVTTRRSHQESGGYSGWNDVPILTLVSMLAYFCFLEELLVIAGKMSTSAISVSLPFCCLLGLLSSTASCIVVRRRRRRFIWLYAATQFAFVVLFAHIFYSVVRMQAVLAILLATFAGLGVTATGSYVLIELLGWRRRRIRPSAQASSHAMPQQSQARESANASVEGESNCPNISATGEPVALV